MPEAALTLGAGFGRPFGYYDGFLFAVWSEALGQDEAIAAGGRYDSLLARMGGTGTSAVGAMVRPARAWNGAVR
ncbi:MAG: ATP phosphoribosyltransferase regulatory subunit [Caulobacteraceae bacterium]